MTVPKHGEHSLKARINLERVGAESPDLAESAERTKKSQPYL